MRFRHLLFAALLCSTALSSPALAGDWPRAGNVWGQGGSSPFNADGQSAHALARDGAIQGRKGKAADMAGNSYTTETYGSKVIYQTITEGDGNTITVKDNTAKAKSSGTVDSRTSFSLRQIAGN